MVKKSLLLLPALVLVLSACQPQTDTTSMTSDDTAMQEETMMQEDSTMMEGEEDGVMVGGAMMVASKDIVDNAVMSKDHTTLVTAVQAAGLAETLKGAGPFTVFAPTNAAFNKLPAGTVETLVKPENKQTLTGILTYHVVPGRYTASTLTDGMTLKTVQGETLKVSNMGGKVTLTDSKGGKSMVTIADVISSNGVTHVVDTVLMPSK